MSKFKEALSTLRERNGTGTGNPSTPGHARNNRQPPGTAADQVIKSDVQNLDAVTEPQPKFRISVSASHLRDEGLMLSDGDGALVAQQFRRIKRPILKIAFSVSDVKYDNGNVIMAASALPSTGKTFCSFNLAVSIAKEKDVSAIVVDADVLKPNITRVFGLEERPGLVDYLTDTSLRLEDILVGTDFCDLSIIPAGKHHDQVTELLSSQRMLELTNQLSTCFSNRAIVFDTPPLLLTNEAQVLAQHMGQIVLVIEAGASSQETVAQALASLDRDKPINAILNKAPGESFGEYGDYGYYVSPK